MGAWGTAISSNDDFADVYEEIMDEFNNGIPIETVINNVLEKYENEFEKDEDSLHNLYFAAAFAAWECGMQDDKVYSKVKEIIESGSDIKCWIDLGASPQDIKKREKALFSFLTKLSTPKEKPRKPKQIKFKPALFEKGDVLSILQDDGSYSGAVVLENFNEDKEFGSNFIVKAFMKNNEKPSILEILNSKIYDYSWYISVHYKKYIKQIEKIGKVEVEFEYKPGGIGSTHSGWITFVSAINQNSFYIKENKDIKNIYAFLHMTPEEIAKRQQERVKRSLSQVLNKNQ
jgi:hypothetical protein